MKRWIHASSFNRTTHIYKGHKIVKITDSGQEMYRVQNMPEDFYSKYWNGIFDTVKSAKRYIDEYEGV